MIFQREVHRKCYAAELWKIIKYGKNLAKNEEKLCSTCLKNPFLHHGTIPKHETQVFSGITRYSSSLIWLLKRDAIYFLLKRACRFLEPILPMFDWGNSMMTQQFFSFPHTRKICNRSRNYAKQMGFSGLFSLVFSISITQRQIGWDMIIASSFFPWHFSPHEVIRTWTTYGNPKF